MYFLNTETCWIKLDIGLLIDSSYDGVNKTSQNLPAQLVNFVQKFVEQFNVSPSQTRFGVVQFASFASFQFGFDTYTNAGEVILRLQSITPIGRNRSYTAAFNSAKNNLFLNSRSDAQKVAVLVTDGIPDTEFNETMATVDDIKKTNILIFVIGLSPDVSSRMCSAVAELDQHSASLHVFFFFTGRGFKSRTQYKSAN